MVNAYAQVAYVAAANGWADMNPFGVVSVTDHGAYGNGVADDTAAIHAARDAAGTGGTVYFPPGTYVCKNVRASVSGQTWTLHPSAILKYPASGGSGDDFVRITASTGVTLTGGTWDFTAATASRTNMIYTTACANVTFRDMIVLSPTAVDGTWYGIAAENVSNVVIDGNTIIGRGTQAIWVQSSVAAISNIRITDNRVDQTGVATTGSGCGAITVHADSDSCRISGVIISSNRVVGPDLDAQTDGGICTLKNDNLVVSGNSINKYSYGLSIVQCTAASLADNSITDFSGIGIEADQTGVTISGNTIDGSSNGKGDAIQTSNSNGSLGTVITGNTFLGLTSASATQRGIFISSSATYDGVIVTGNSFRFTGASVAMQTNAPLKNVTFTGNSVSGNGNATARGIYTTVGPIDGLTIAGNQFYDVEDAVRFSCSSSNTLNNIAVVGNSLSSVTSLRTTSLSGGAAFGTNVSFQANNDNTRDCAVTRVKAGTPSDSDFDAPVTGMVVVDTTGNKIWVRTGSATWKSVTVA